MAYKQTDTVSNIVYQETTAFNGRGQGTEVKYGNGVSSSFVYDTKTGWLKSSETRRGSAVVQNYQYGFDDVGNVTSRELSFGVGSNGNLTESFGYDDLHRLTSRNVTAAVGLSGSLSMSEAYSYDKLGNLKTKTGVGLYNFVYDSNGNITHDGKRRFDYTAFEKPYRITQGSDSTDFVYGPNRELIQRIDKRGSNTTSTLMLDGIYEQVTLPGGITEYKYYVADAVVTKRSNSTLDTFYLHKDQQGSTTAITNATGDTVQQLMYDPWGKQFLVNNSILTYTSPAQSKGYTGHEMVNDFEVIHMGGRTYNPTLGRFMQADPFIQAPGNLQSYNRYAYVQNNPMSYTDPSGYFLKKLMQVTGVTAAMKFLANNAFLNGIVMAALNFIPGCQGWCSAAFAAVQSYAVTGSLGGALRAGLFAYVGTGVGALGNFGGFAGFVASGIAGGALSVLQGGKFGHGFVSAGLGASLGGLGGRVGNPFGQVLVSAVIGGTISKVTGGKFINGAGSAAFAAALRADWGGQTDPLRSSADEPKLADLSPEQRLAFDKGLSDLQDSLNKINSNGGFKNADEAASWLHDNVHPLSMKYDVEIGARLLDKFSYVVVAELTTQHYSNAVYVNEQNDDFGIWHSHGKLGTNFTQGADTDWVDSRSYRRAYVSIGYVGGSGASLYKRINKVESKICGVKC